MSNKAEKRLVPVLRFPEFRREAGWEIQPLRKLAKLIEDRAGTEKYTLLSVTSGVGLVTQIEKFGREIAGNQYKNYFVIRRGDFAYNKSATIKDPEGFIALLESHEQAAVPNSIFTCFRLKNESNSPQFFKHLFSTNIHGNWLRRFITIGARANGSLNIDSNDLLSLPLGLPTSLEQRKIADCLSSIDDLIVGQAKKIEALKAHKKGLMQQLFPAEGETVPRLRFPEFRDATGWEQRKLEDLAKRGSGHTPSKSSAEYYGGGVKWVSLADTSRLDNGLILDTAKEISELGIKHSSAVLHPAGTVILSRDAGVGKSAVTGCPMAVSQHFIAWVCHPNKLYNWFLYYVLQNGKPLFERIATGSTIKTIGLPFFVELRIAVPSLYEQRRIADCLSSLDTLITTQSEKLEALKAQKQGLMQGLFPSISEVEA